MFSHLYNHVLIHYLKPHFRVPGLHWWTREMWFKPSWSSQYSRRDSIEWFTIALGNLTIGLPGLVVKESFPGEVIFKTRGKSKRYPGRVWLEHFSQRYQLMQKFWKSKKEQGGKCTRWSWKEVTGQATGPYIPPKGCGSLLWQQWKVLSSCCRMLGNFFLQLIILALMSASWAGTAQTSRPSSNVTTVRLSLTTATRVSFFSTLP